jgi:hypothetical protein
MHFVDFCSMPTKEYNYTKSDKPSKMISEHMRNSFFAKKKLLGDTVCPQGVSEVATNNMIHVHYSITINIYIYIYIYIYTRLQGSLRFAF